MKIKNLMVKENYIKQIYIYTLGILKKAKKQVKDMNIGIIMIILKEYFKKIEN